MIPYERKERLLKELENREIVHINEFKSYLGGTVSESTIRRDLKQLEDEGKVVVLRGGAAKLRKDKGDTPIISRKKLNIKAKEKIAKKAAEFVQDGDVIYIDAGSTTLSMIKYLKDMRITVVTTNALLLTEITDENISCVMIGGEVILSTGSIVGSITDNTLRNINFDKAFLGASGYSLQYGINTFDIREVNKKQIVKSNSLETFFLLDTNKENLKATYKIFDIYDCKIISEAETDLLVNNSEFILAD